MNEYIDTPEHLRAQIEHHAASCIALVTVRAMFSPGQPTHSETDHFARVHSEIAFLLAARLASATRS